MLPGLGCYVSGYGAHSESILGTGGSILSIFSQQRRVKNQHNTTITFHFSGDVLVKTLAPQELFALSPS
jgi:hypothetical protein